MKKIMGLMLGLSLVLGTVAFAQDSSTASTDTGAKKAKKHHKKAKKDTSGAMSSDTSSTK